MVTSFHWRHYDGGSEMSHVRKTLLFSWVIFILTILFLEVASGDAGIIDMEDPETPLKESSLRFIEASDDGDKVFVCYNYQGISMIDLSEPSITHFNETSDLRISGSYVMNMHYDNVGKHLFVVCYNYTNSNYVLDIIRTEQMNAGRMLLRDVTAAVRDMEYDSRTGILYIATGNELILIDVGTEIVSPQVVAILQPTGGILSNELVDIQLIPSINRLFVATTNYDQNFIFSLDTEIDDFVESETLELGDMGSSGYVATDLQAFTYDVSHDEYYLSFVTIDIGAGDMMRHLGYMSGTDVSTFIPLNTSLYITYPLPYTRQGEGYLMEGTGITTLIPARNDELILFNMADNGAGVVDTSDHTVRILKNEFDYPYGYGRYVGPYVSGGIDIAYSTGTDTAWVASTLGLAYFDPDETTLSYQDGQPPDGEDPPTEEVHMISLYSMEKKGDMEDSKDLEEDTVLGPDEELHIWASAPYDPASPVDHMVLKLIRQPSGVSVLEKRENGTYISKEIDVKDLSSGRYTVRIEAKDVNGNTLYEDEDSFSVDNPVSVPVVPALTGASLAIVGGVGAGLAVHAIGSSASAAAAGAASGTASGAAGSGFSWKNLLFGFATEYGEEQLKDRTGRGGTEEVSFDKKGSFITLREVLTMIISVIVLVIGFGYVEMMGLLTPNRTVGILGVDLFTIPEFSIRTFLVVVPIVFFTSAFIILGIELVEELSAKVLGLWSEFRIWPVGMITLLLSALFLMPFGYPGKAVPKSDRKITGGMEGFIGSSVLVSMLAFMFPFTVVYLIGYLARGNWFTDMMNSFGTIGVSMLIMMFAYSVIPFKPMDGNRIWRFNKVYLVLMLLLAISLFWLWTFKLVVFPLWWRQDHIIYFPGWAVASFLLFVSVIANIGLVAHIILGLKLRKEYKSKWEEELEEETSEEEGKRDEKQRKKKKGKKEKKKTGHKKEKGRSKRKRTNDLWEE